MARNRRVLSFVALAASGCLFASGCSVVMSWVSGDGPPVVREEFPYVKEGVIFQDTGQDATMRFAITGLERTDDYTVLHYEITYPDEFEGANRNLSMTYTLVDPMTGRVYRPYVDDEGMKYGSVSPTGNGMYPVFPGVTNEYRRYFPPLPPHVRQVTFVGSGLGAMTGIPVQDVDEERPEPENPNGGQYLSVDQPPAAGEKLTFDNRRPDEDAVAVEGWVESFVDSEIASVTRDGTTETISLHSDVMFEFDRADLTPEAEAVVRRAAETLERNVDPDHPEIIIIGHTDGIGTDAYNDDLSVRRAETVRNLLVEEMGTGYTYVVEGRGSREPIAREGGPDDEQARARNRRVEFSYTIRMPGGGEEETDDGLGVAGQHVSWPAPFTDDPGEVVASVERDGVRLDVYPLRRDGAFVVGTVTFTNLTDTPVDPGLTGFAVAGGPERFSKGTLGGFQVVEPESGLVRYVAQMNFGDGVYSAFAEEVHRLQPDRTYELVAVFSAPSSEVESVTLRAGPFGEIPDVPIE